MQKLTIALGAVLVMSLSGCLETDGERALAGGAAGIVAADVLNVNPVAGAAIGALGGAVCDDLNVAVCK
jgi:hypothetical protein